MRVVQYIRVTGYELEDMADVRQYDLWLKSKGITRHCDYCPDHGLVCMLMYVTDEEYAEAVRYLDEHNMQWSLDF